MERSAVRASAQLARSRASHLRCGERAPRSTQDRVRAATPHLVIGSDGCAHDRRRGRVAVDALPDPGVPRRNGAWGHGSFANDSAMDWLGELREGDPSVVDVALTAVADAADDVTGRGQRACLRPRRNWGRLASPPPRKTRRPPEPSGSRAVIAPGSGPAKEGSSPRTSTCYPLPAEQGRDQPTTYALAKYAQVARSDNQRLQLLFERARNAVARTERPARRSAPPTSC
jgi:hypothetical protein